jgi:ABC-type multidrug transport system ATPase subunit
VLAVRNLSHAWPGRPLFNGLSFDAHPGLGWIVGDEGCGKSTLLALLGGALVLQGGTCSVAGVSLHEQPDRYREQVFWIDPQTDAHHALNARAYWSSLERTYPAFQASHLPMLIDAFSLQDHVEKPLYMLSTGSRRKVWWAAAIASGAPLVLMDQPFAALDAPSARALQDIVAELAQEGDTCWLMTGHEKPQRGNGQIILEL